MAHGILMLGALCAAFIVLLVKLHTWLARVDRRLVDEWGTRRAAADSAGADPVEIKKINRQYGRARIGMRVFGMGSFTLLGMVLITYLIAETPSLGAVVLIFLWLTYFGGLAVYVCRGAT